jgi:hypothetical protein
MPTAQSDATAAPAERAIHVLIALLLGAVYVAVGFEPLRSLASTPSYPRGPLFGFAQVDLLARREPIALVLVALSGLLLFTWRGRVRPSAPHDGARGVRPALRVGLAALAVVVFVLLRSNSPNPDGVSYTEKLERDVPLYGAHLTHDEMWEFYIHSRFWLYTSKALGWSVERSYQALSCLGGGVFVYLLLTYSPRLLPRMPLLATLFCVSGGYVQLFFGDVENYTLTTACLMAYFLASALFLEGRRSVVAPSLALAVAMSFHLLSGFLLPSLAYLWLVAWRRGARRSVGWSVLGLVATVGGTVAFMHFHGLPLGEIWSSHAFAHGGHYESVLVRPRVRYYWKMVNLAFLLVPAWVLLPLLLRRSRSWWDSAAVHLLVASLGLLVLVLVWRAALGIYNDWNLFAPAALPVTLLVWRGVLHEGELQSRRSSLRLLGWVFFLHSYAWIILNHLGPDAG